MSERRITIASLLVSDSVPVQHRSGDSTSSRRSPEPEVSPARGFRTSTSSSAIARSRSACSGEGLVVAARLEQQPHRHAREHRRQPDDVVGVRMARDHDVEPLHPERRELGGDLVSLRSPVDEHRGTLRAS